SDRRRTLRRRGERPVDGRREGRGEGTLERQLEIAPAGLGVVVRDVASTEDELRAIDEEELSVHAPSIRTEEVRLAAGVVQLLLEDQAASSRVPLVPERPVLFLDARVGIGRESDTDAACHGAREDVGET